MSNIIPAGLPCVQTFTTPTISLALSIILYIFLYSLSHFLSLYNYLSHLPHDFSLSDRLSLFPLSLTLSLLPSLRQSVCLHPCDSPPLSLYVSLSLSLSLGLSLSLSLSFSLRGWKHYVMPRAIWEVFIRPEVQARIPSELNTNLLTDSSHFTTTQYLHTLIRQ